MWPDIPAWHKPYLLHQLSYHPYLHHMVERIHVCPRRKSLHPDSAPCHYHPCPPPSGTATLKTRGSKIKRNGMKFYGRWEDAQVWEHWKVTHCILQTASSSVGAQLWSETAAFTLTRRFLLSPLRSDPLSIGGWWMFPARPHCGLWLVQSEGAGVRLRRKAQPGPHAS